MISAKLATPGLFKTKTFRGKGYDIIIPDKEVQTKFYHVTQTKLNYFYIIMGPNFGNSSISMREVFIT